MSEDKVSLAILINNENIPTDIFSSSVDKYFGPQMEDFSKSSLVVCILSQITGLTPNEENIATYIKSQWLFMTACVENKVFEFNVAICDSKNWTITAQEEEVERREIRTFPIESDKTFLIRINWNKPLTFSIESLTELYSMDESFIKSHYESNEIIGYDNGHQGFLEPIQNLDTIQEDVDDNDSLVDSLQGISNNCEKHDLSGSEDSLEEQVLDIENYNVKDVNDSLEDLHNILQPDFVPDCNDFDTINNILENKICTIIKEDRDDYESIDNCLRGIPMGDINCDLCESDDLLKKKIGNTEEHNFNTYDNSVKCVMDTVPDQSICRKDPEMLKERKAARILKIQSIFGMKSELETIKKSDIEIKRKSKDEDGLKNGSRLNLKNETINVSETPCYEEFNSLEEYETQKVKSKVYTESICVALSNAPITILIADGESNTVHNIDLPDELEEMKLYKPVKDNQLVNNEKDNIVLGINKNTNKYSTLEHNGDIEDKVKINAEFTDKVSPIIIVQSSIQHDIKKTNEKDVSESAIRTFDDQEYDNTKVLAIEFSGETHNNITNNDDNNSSVEIENSNDEKNILRNDPILISPSSILQNSLLFGISDKETISKNIFNHVNQKEISDVGFEENYSEKDIIPLCVETTQQTVENVVEMFEKLRSQEEEPHILSKRYKVDNVEFDKLKQIFEVDGVENKADSLIKYSKDINKINEKNFIVMDSHQEKIETESISENPKEEINADRKLQFSTPKMNSEKKERKLFSGENTYINDDKVNLKNMKDIKEMNEISTHLSIKDIKRIVKEKREKLAVNDDYKYPDSVTPTKVEHNLLKSPEYNVPFMDDDAFYNENWYEESDDRWTSLERSTINNTDNLLSTPGTECSTNLLPVSSINIFKETESIQSEILKISIKKEPKRKGFIDLCGCVSGR